MKTDFTGMVKNAAEIAELAENNGIIAIEKKTGLNRAVIYHLIHLNGLCGDLKDIFLTGKIGLKPLVELDKEFGSDPLLKACLSFISDNPNKNIKKPAILKIIGSESVNHDKTECQPSIKQSSGQAQESTTRPIVSDEPVNTSPVTEVQQVAVDQEGVKASKTALNEISAIITEAASNSQDNESLILYKSDFIKIMERIHLHQQFLDDLDENNEQQGDQTDQSYGSFVFENMVESTIEPDMTPDYENFSQEEWA